MMNPNLKTSCLIKKHPCHTSGIMKKIPLIRTTCTISTPTLWFSTISEGRFFDESGFSKSYGTVLKWAYYKSGDFTHISNVGRTL